MKRKEVKPREMPCYYLCQERGMYPSPLGPVLRLKIWAQDEQPMSWEEVWQVFADNYPDSWAIQVFPPERFLVNEANRYHLWVLPIDLAPTELNIYVP